MSRLAHQQQQPDFATHSKAMADCAAPWKVNFPGNAGGGYPVDPPGSPQYVYLSSVSSNCDRENQQNEEKQDKLGFKKCKGETCNSDIKYPAVFETQEGLCTTCIPEGPLKAAVQVRDHMLNINPAFPNKIDSADHLQKMVECIFDRVVQDAADEQEHDLHVDRYSRYGQIVFADEMLSLRLVAPTFPVENDKPRTFMRILLNVTQDKFEEMVKKYAAPAIAPGEPEAMRTLENQLLALVSFIGHLYVRKLVAARVMAQVVHDLIGVRDRQPAQSLIQCVVALMYVIGKTIDASKQGNMLMTQFIARLKNLAATGLPDGRGCMYKLELRSSVGELCSVRESQKWPSRAGTQVVVQHSEIDDKLVGQAAP